MPGGLTVATQFRAYAGFQGRPGDALDRLPAARPQAFELAPRPPEALRQGLDRTDGAFGSVRWAGRDVLVALYAPEGSSMRMPLLCVDADGDGSFEGAGEQRRVTGHAGDRGQRWKAELTVEGVPAVLEVERTPLLRRVARVDGGVRRMQALEPPPPGGVLVPGGGKADLLARVRVGEAFVLVGATFDGEGGARVGYDLDGDRRLDLPAEWREAESVNAQTGERAWRVAATRVRGEDVTLRVEERPARISGTLSAPGALRGTVTVGGRTLALFLLDRDLDGSFTAHEDLWWFGPAERLDHVHELSAETMVEGDEPAFVGGAAWRIRIVEADGTAHLAPDPEVDVGAYLARRHQRVSRDWAVKLEVEARVFREANAIDPARARAPEPVAWRFASELSGGLEAARQSDRPVFVVFEADWCQWCHRLDFHTFWDAEVAGLLARFECIRINYEFLSSKDYERYGGRGLPFLLFMDGSGRLLERTDRGPCDSGRGAVLRNFEAPHVFVGRLRAALATWEALQASR